MIGPEMPDRYNPEVEPNALFNRYYDNTAVGSGGCVELRQTHSGPLLIDLGTAIKLRNELTQAIEDADVQIRESSTVS